MSHREAFKFIITGNYQWSKSACCPVSDLTTIRILYISYNLLSSLAWTVNITIITVILLLLLLQLSPVIINGPEVAVDLFLTSQPLEFSI